MKKKKIPEAIAKAKEEKGKGKTGGKGSFDDGKSPGKGGNGAAHVIQNPGPSAPFDPWARAFLAYLTKRLTQ